jgi:hypothetical protein
MPCLQAIVASGWMAVIPGCSELSKGDIRDWRRAGTCPDAVWEVTKQCDGNYNSNELNPFIFRLGFILLSSSFQGDKIHPFALGWQPHQVPDPAPSHQNVDDWCVVGLRNVGWFVQMDVAINARWFLEYFFQKLSSGDFVQSLCVCLCFMCHAN